jgi:RNA polymerase sigma-70 factor, ECF subfamily
MKQHLEALPAVRPQFETVYTVGLSFLRQTLRWLGVAERDIDDVLQEVMLAAYRRLDTFDPTWTPHPTNGEPKLDPARGALAASAMPCEPLKRWLFGIAWRQVGHYRDRAYRRREVAVGAGASWPFDPADPGPSSEQLLASEERSRLISRLLGAIDIDRRLVLIMYDLLDISIAEIGQELQLNENTVRNRLRLAREDFRVAVKRLNAEERRALRTSLALPVLELSRAPDEEAVIRAARFIPEAPDPVRRRVWAALALAIAEGQRRDVENRSAAAAPS